MLVEESQRLGVELRLKADVQDINFESTEVTLSNGEVISGDVIIGADGNLVLFPCDLCLIALIYSFEF